MTIKPVPHKEFGPRGLERLVYLRSSVLEECGSEYICKGLFEGGERGGGDPVYLDASPVQPRRNRRIVIILLAS